MFWCKNKQLSSFLKDAMIYLQNYYIAHFLHKKLEDLVDISVSESDRYYPAFQFVIWGGKTPKEALDAALIEVVGEA